MNKAAGGMWCANIGLGRDEMAQANDTAYRVTRMYQNARGKRDKRQALRREGPRTDQDA